MKKIVVAVVLLIAAGIGIAHWYFSDRGRFTTAPEFTGLSRSVSGNELRSAMDPPAVLRFGPRYEYLGGQRFILYGVADTEQHFFVETDGEGALRSIYWVQFEAYLPGEPHRYDYEDSPLRLEVGDLEFFTDAAVFHNDPDARRRRGTDGALVRQFLASKGLAYPDEVMYVRMVYLTDESRQKELMIIFMDDLSHYGFTAADLEAGGARHAAYAGIVEAHLDRVRESLTVLQLSQFGSQER